jgi:hemerythrin-like domain-containing protein
MTSTPSPPGSDDVRASEVPSRELRAYEAMLHHHETLVGCARSLAEALSAAASEDRPHEVELRSFIAYFTGEVFPHAAAEERTIYRAAMVRADLAPTVEAMIREHGALRVAVEQLGQPSTGADAAMLADSIVTLFVAHVVKENELLLPRLLADRSVDLAQLLEQMHGPEAPSDDTQRPG